MLGGRGLQSRRGGYNGGAHVRDGGVGYGGNECNGRGKMNVVFGDYLALGMEKGKMAAKDEVVAVKGKDKEVVVAGKKKEVVAMIGTEVVAEKEKGEVVVKEKEMVADKGKEKVVEEKGKEVVVADKGTEVVVAYKRKEVVSDKGKGKAKEEEESCNLDSFLNSTTPSIDVHYLSKTNMRGFSTCNVNYEPYFVLGDLWDSFSQWSAYGAGVPLVLNTGDHVVQYYGPSLSGIQIYCEDTLSPKSTSDDSFRDTSSEGSGDYEVDRNLQHLMDRLSVRNGPVSLQEGFSSDDGEGKSSEGSLAFEFLEKIIPFHRQPFADKIYDLSCQFPQLNTLRSCDLSPSSWISIAWYPIYRIPTGPTLKELEICFLTFHFLSTSMTGAGNAQAPVMTYPAEPEGIPKMSLPVFALASYKFQSSMWAPSRGREIQLSNSMLRAAHDWLRVVGASLPDFNFFVNPSGCGR